MAEKNRSTDLSDKERREALWNSVDWESVTNLGMTIELLDRKTKTTPDYFELKTRRWLPLFVYGLEKIGHSLNEILWHNERTRDHSFYLGRAMSATPTYTMEVAVNNIPVAYKTKNRKLGNKLWGELWMVSPVTLMEFDHLYGNNLKTGYYNRQRVMVKCLDQTFKANGGNCYPFVSAEAFLANEEFWEYEDTTKVLPTKFGVENVLDWKEIPFGD